jgi:hypothetical protein
VRTLTTQNDYCDENFHKLKILLAISKASFHLLKSILWIQYIPVGPLSEPEAAKRLVFHGVEKISHTGTNNTATDWSYTYKYTSPTVWFFGRGHLTNTFSATAWHTKRFACRRHATPFTAATGRLQGLCQEAGWQQREGNLMITRLQPVLSLKMCGPSPQVNYTSFGVVLRYRNNFRAKVTFR